MFNQIPLKANAANSIQLYFQLFIKGNEKGASYIYNQLFWRLFNYSYIVIKNEFETNSIVHNAFLKAWIHREKMNSILHLQRYLFTSVKWGCYKYLNSNYHKKRASHLPGYVLIDEHVNSSLEEDEMKYESKELLVLIKKAIPYLKVNKTVVKKLTMSGLSHHQINEAVGAKYKDLTEELCYRIKVLKNITRKIKKTQEASKKNFTLSGFTIQDYLSPLECKIFHDYYEKKHSLNRIAEELNISPLKALQHHFYIIYLIEKVKKKGHCIARRLQ